jgi:hypothetical protein
MYPTAVYLQITLRTLAMARARACVCGAGEVSRYSDELRAGRPGFYPRQGQEIFLFSVTSTQALRPTHLAAYPVGKAAGA